MGASCCGNGQANKHEVCAGTIEESPSEKHFMASQKKFKFEEQTLNTAREDGPERLATMQIIDTVQRKKDELGPYEPDEKYEDDGVELF